MNHSQLTLTPAPNQDLAPFAQHPNGAALAIRVWTPAGGSVKWSEESPLNHLISDLVSASDGSLVQDAPSGFISCFSHAPMAFRAAKRIQWAVLDFCQQRPQLCLGVAMLIFEAGDVSGKSEDAVGRAIGAALEEARPAQILVASNAREHLAALPGLQLRSVPPALGYSEWRGAVQELVWTTPSNLERAQEVFQNLVRTFAQPDAHVAASEPTVDFSAEGKRTAPPTLVHGVDAPVEARREPNAYSELTDPEPDSESSGSHSLWWLLAGASAVAIVVAVVLFLPRLLPNSTTAKDLPSRAVESAPARQTAPAETEAPSVQTQTTESDPSAEPNNSSKPEPKPATTDLPATRRQPAKGVAEVGGLTAKDIPRLIQMAETDAGAGRYEEARHEFKTVLLLDPNNAEAKLGLRKLDLSEREAR
jgi:hypothetical protein